MTPRFDIDEWAFENGYEDLSDLTGSTPPSGYNYQELYPHYQDFSEEEDVDTKKNKVKPSRNRKV